MMKKPKTLTMAAAIGVVITACQAQNQQDAPRETGGSHNTAIEGSVSRAVAVLHPTEGNQVEGTVEFEKVGEAVRVTGALRNLSPGMHGFHLHEYGDCSAPDGSSAGGHYAPRGNPHGGPDDQERHVGDLGNIEANQEGIVQISMIDSVITLSGDHSIIGRAVVVHQGEDDLSTQPAGDAGPRVACGIVGIKGPENK